ncbi:MAG: M23 family metallopeptidase [Flavobacteriaceae bacterium]
MNLKNHHHLNLISKLIFLVVMACTVMRCTTTEKEMTEFQEVKEDMKFGYNMNNFFVVQDTIQRGESFGEILSRYNVDFSKIYKIANQAKDTFDIRQLRAGKPYMLLCSKDEKRTPQSFIYQPNKIEYVVLEFCDSIIAYKQRKPVKIVEKEAFGEIKSSLSETMEAQGLPIQLIYDMSDDIYAWTIDFFRLQEGDNFKVIYKQRFVEDSIYAGIESIDAAYFEHKGEPIYAFDYITPESKNSTDYYDETGKSLQKAFLKSPVKFSRISSRYNKNRRIAYYGNKVRPHKGTDFAAPVGTPILATASGTVVESTRRGGNGKYVKIRHNATYSTQYLHMSKRMVNVGDFVKQGDVIGKVGMTGNTSGPHVCYRFWKNGRQVDPFRQKLPDAKALPKQYKTDYLAYISPLKQRLDSIN